MSYKSAWVQDGTVFCRSGGHVREKLERFGLKAPKLQAGSVELWSYSGDVSRVSEYSLWSTALTMDKSGSAWACSSATGSG